MPDLWDSGSGAALSWTEAGWQRCRSMDGAAPDASGGVDCLYRRCSARGRGVCAVGASAIQDRLFDWRRRIGALYRWSGGMEHDAARTRCFLAGRVCSLCVDCDSLVGGAVALAVEASGSRLATIIRPAAHAAAVEGRIFVELEHGDPLRIPADTTDDRARAF